MVVTGSQLQVIGEGAVTIVDESEMIHSNTGEILRDEPLAVCGARPHILPHGYKFDLKTRKPKQNGFSRFNRAISIPYSVSSARCAASPRSSLQS